MLFHITTEATWAAVGEFVHAASLEREGFVHLSSETQWPRTLARWFSRQTGLVLLEIDPARLTSEVRWEEAHGERFPHLYGALPRAAVIAVSQLDVDDAGLHRAAARETMPP